MAYQRLALHGCPFRRIMLIFSAVLFCLQLFRTDSEAQEARRVRVGYSALSLSFLPHLYAKDAGIFERHGLAVELIQVAGPIQVAALAAQEIDFGAAVSPGLFAAVRGLPLKGIMITVKTPLFYIVVEPAITRLDDLAGKKMAVDTVGALQYIAARMMLKKKGVNPDLVSYIQTGSVSNSLAALASGAVNAALLSIPNNVVMTQKGFLQLASTPEAQVNYPPSGLMAHANKVQKDIGLIRRTVGALLDAQKSIESDKQAVTDYIQRRWKLEPKIAEETYRLVLPTLPPNGRLSLDEVQGFLDVAFENKQIPQKASSQGIMDYTLLDNVLKERGSR